jgi:hypothetical protein
MSDIKNPRVLWVKFGLFLVVGLFASTIALLLFPSIRLAALLALAIWAFCRAYYFAFYVIEHYADPAFRYAGISSFIRYAWRRRRKS